MGILSKYSPGHWLTWGLAGLLLLLVILGVFAHDVQYWDEATNLQVVKESAASATPWNLEYYGGYFWEKPPLFYWINILFYRLLAFDSTLLPFSMRLSAGLFGLMLAGLAAYSVYLGNGEPSEKQEKDEARIARVNYLLLFIAAVPMFWRYSPTGELATHNLRSADSDVLQLFFIFTALFLLHFYRANLLAGIAIGLAVLLKGPLGFLPLLYFIFSRRKGQFNPRQTLAAAVLVLGVALIIILPWHLYMYHHFGWEFIEEYLIYHQLARTGTSLEGHLQPWWFYPSLILDPRFYLTPVLLLPLLLLNSKLSEWGRVNLALALVSLIVFQLSGTKISWYLLPGLFLLLIPATEIIASNRIKILIIIIFVAQIITTIFGYASSKDSIQVYLINNPVQYYCADESEEYHRVFNFYELKLIDNPDLDADEYLISSNNAPSRCLPKSDYTLLKITPNYAIVRLQ